MPSKIPSPSTLSPWWRVAVVAVAVGGLAVLTWISALAYRDAPPIPDRVVSAGGDLLFRGADVRAGQEVLLKHGLMENGTVWGHGAYLGPDFSAAYLHELVLDARDVLGTDRYGVPYGELDRDQRAAVDRDVREELRENRYDPVSRTLRFTKAEVASFRQQVSRWAGYFADQERNGGLRREAVRDPVELRQLTAFFAWTAWASAANRPGSTHSYTNNFPYDPDVGNRPTAQVVLWSALSLITLLAGTAAILFAFGKFHYLGWKRGEEDVAPLLTAGEATESQRAAIKFFVVVSLLFLAQVLVGGATAHTRAEPGTFYGLDLYQVFPTNILRTWHLQLAIFWIATSYVAGGLVLGTALGEREPPGQARWVHLLFWALVVVAAGSLAGEFLGIHQLLGDLWFWFGNQGWEYLDLGRAWQALLVVGFALWVWLLVRAVRPALGDPGRREMAWLFLIAAGAIPFFYLPAFFFGSSTSYTVADNWRFWIIHLWVEGFFELFVTTMVAVTFFRMGLVARSTAARVVYLDAILFLGAGIIGTGHHWYWTGQGGWNLALSSLFSAMEVVPLTLLTLDAWDFIRLTRGEERPPRPRSFESYRWVFFFLMAVGFWNFLGAGIFGFLINLPIVSYFEIGTLLTPNHGHAALMGVFGMEAVALMVLGLRQVLTDEEWERPQRYVRVSFWGLNVGLLLMVAANLFPGGVLQLYDVVTNGYWHARGPEYLGRELTRALEWARMPGDLVFIFLGVVPLVGATLLSYRAMRRRPVTWGKK